MLKIAGPMEIKAINDSIRGWEEEGRESFKQVVGRNRWHPRERKKSVIKRGCEKRRVGKTVVAETKENLLGRINIRIRRGANTERGGKGSKEVGVREMGCAATKTAIRGGADSAWVGNADRTPQRTPATTPLQPPRASASRNWLEISTVIPIK